MMLQQNNFGDSVSTDCDLLYLISLATAFIQHFGGARMD